MIDGKLTGRQIGLSVFLGMCFVLSPAATWGNDHAEIVEIQKQLKQLQESLRETQKLLKEAKEGMAELKASKLDPMTMAFFKEWREERRKYDISRRWLEREQKRTEYAKGALRRTAQAQGTAIEKRASSLAKADQVSQQKAPAKRAKLDVGRARRGYGFGYGYGYGHPYQRYGYGYGHPFYYAPAYDYFPIGGFYTAPRTSTFIPGRGIHSSGFRFRGSYQGSNYSFRFGAGALR